MVKTLNEIVEGVDYEEIMGDPDAEIGNMEIDSRKVIPGSMFFALRGTNTDGHDFIDTAVLSGARAVVCETIPQKISNNISYIRVRDSARALGLMASSFYGHPSHKIKLTGITGTNGKTTTGTLLYRMFSRMGYRTGLISTINYFIHERKLPARLTTPDPVKLNWLLSEMVKEGCAYCFMEVSSHSIAQHRISGLHFTGGIFTNISRDHLDYHGNFSEYLNVKKQFFDLLEEGSFALINQDDRNAGFMVQNTKATVKSYALKSVADFRGNIIEKDRGGMLLKLNGRELWTSLMGSFNASNILAVFATGILLGAEEDEALKILSSLTPVEGRFETMRSDGKVTAIVDYAHTPDALENVIEAITPLLDSQARLITVAGAGGDRDKGKRPVMAGIAAEKSSKLILTSDNPRSEDPELIIRDMLEGVEEAFRDRVICISNRREAIRTACMMARAGDFILVAGKGHETYQEIKGVKHHFDDREVVLSVFKSMQKI